VLATFLTKYEFNILLISTTKFEHCLFGMKLGFDGFEFDWLQSWEVLEHMLKFRNTNNPGVQGDLTVATVPSPGLTSAK
jgi:hypothetical protein